MKYIIGLGSNDGDREAHLQYALNALTELADSLFSSTHYESPALGGGKTHYLNAVAEMTTHLDIESLNKELKHIELITGRDASARAEGRVPLDADIVIAGNKIIRPKDFAQFFFKRGYEELRSDFSDFS